MLITIYNFPNLLLINLLKKPVTIFSNTDNRVMLFQEIKYYYYEEIFVGSLQQLLT